jgi:hypothetical protein
MVISRFRIMAAEVMSAARRARLWCFAQQTSVQGMVRLPRGSVYLSLAILLLCVRASAETGAEPKPDSLWADSTLRAVPGDSAGIALPDSVHGADTTSVLKPDAVFLPPDTSNRIPPKPAVPVTDSLLSLLNPTSPADISRLDLAQYSDRFDYDPFLARVYQFPWGEEDAIYPLGLPPAALSRADDLFGDASFSNPVPLPHSEYYLRATPSDRYSVLTPALSGLFNPFGRLVTVYQSVPDFVSDTAQSQVDVARGRGGFSNTYASLGTRFGSVTTFWFDANIIRYQGIHSFTNARVNRMRFILGPQLDRRVRSRFAFFFNRLGQNVLFFPQTYSYLGSVSDNYSGGAGQIEYDWGDGVSSGLDISYRNDDQSFDYTNLIYRQRYQVVDATAYHRLSTAGQNLELSLKTEYVKYTVFKDENRFGYYTLSFRDLISVSDHMTVFANLALCGGEDLTDKPSVTAIVSYRQSPQLTLSLVASHSVLFPEPEEKYLSTVTGSFAFTFPDYRITGNRGLDIGRVDAGEVMLALNPHPVEIELRAGFAGLQDVPLWSIDHSQYIYGDFQSRAVDRNLVFMTAQARCQLPYNFWVAGTYGYRQLYKSGINYTYGPEHTGAGLAGVSLLVPKVLVTVSGAASVKFRSATNRYFDGGNDGTLALTESFLSFDLKQFHFYYNFNNVLSTKYSLDGLTQPGRSLWWGFRWEFLD